MMVTPRAKPTRRATETNDCTPFIKVSTNSFSGIRTSTAISTDATRKTVVISSNHQSLNSTPPIIVNMVPKNKINKKAFFFPSEILPLSVCSATGKGEATFPSKRYTNDLVGSFFTFCAYCTIYQVVIPVVIKKMSMRSYKPSVQLIPAAFEARIVENGLANEVKFPTLQPAKITATGTSRSYPASRNSGIRIGENTIPSLAMPSADPQNVKKKVTMIISHVSFPFILCER